MAGVAGAGAPVGPMQICASLTACLTGKIRSFWAGMMSPGSLVFTSCSGVHVCLADVNIPICKKTKEIFTSVHVFTSFSKKMDSDTARLTGASDGFLGGQH